MDTENRCGKTKTAPTPNDNATLQTNKKTKIIHFKARQKTKKKGGGKRHNAKCQKKIVFCFVFAVQMRAILNGKKNG